MVTKTIKANKVNRKGERRVFLRIEGEEEEEGGGFIALKPLAIGRVTLFLCFVMVLVR